MGEKKNNSNNPSEKQPTLDDGTYTFKGKSDLSDALLGVLSKEYNPKKPWVANDNNYSFAKTAGLNEDEIKYVYHELAKKGDGTIVHEDGSPFDYDKYFGEDDGASDDLDLEGLEDIGASEDWDEDMSDLEDAGVSESFDEKPKIQLEGQKADIFNAAGSYYGLSDEKIEKASQEQIDALQKALEDKIVAESNIKLLDAKIESTQKELNIAQKYLDSNGSKHALFGVFKDKTIYEKDYDEYKYKLAAKKDYYKSIIDNPSETESSKKFANQKLKEIDEYEIASQAFDANSQNELKEKVDELGKQFSDLLEKKNQAKETIDKSKEVINQFVDENAPYSEERKSKALSFGFNSPSSISGGDLYNAYKQSKKYLSAEAKQQWDSMTQEEQAYLTYYTTSYSWANEPLRGQYYSGGNMPKYNSDGYVSAGAPNKKKGFEKGVNQMTSAISKCKLKEDMWFQRWTGDLDIGITKSLFDYVHKNGADSVVGLTFRHKNFASMGASKGYGYGNSKITMNLYCPKGVEAHYIAGSQGGVGSENEIILNRGYSMSIRKCEIGDDGSIYLDVDVLVGSNTKEALDQDLQDALYYV